MSQATRSFTEAELHELLLKARHHNAQVGITGLLLYGNKQFVQVLEGEEAAVRALYAHIKGDARHRDVIAYADKEIEQRAFDEWTMAFQSVTPQQLAEVVGYVAPEEILVDKHRLRLVDAQLFDLLRSFALPTSAPAG